jgi:hypothetical protein
MDAGAAPFTLQFASDLHLEGVFSKGRSPPADLIVPAAKYLALAGDICTLTGDMLPAYGAWLRSIAERFSRVYVLAGNHEFYGVSMAEGHAALQTLCALSPKLKYMNCTRDDVDGVTILGCTLWSHIHKCVVRGSADDYRYCIQ